MSAWESNEEIQIFREYLRIASVHPDIDYRECPIIDFGVIISHLNVLSECNLTRQ